MPVPMPSAVVLIVCKTVIAGEPDINAKWTGYENREWLIEDSMMQCRRQEIPLTHPTKTEFTPNDCLRASLMVGVEWDQSHKSSSYRWFASACPVRIINTITGETIGWKVPECPKIHKRGKKDRVAIHCEIDTAI